MYVKLKLAGAQVPRSCLEVELRDPSQMEKNTSYSRPDLDFPDFPDLEHFPEHPHPKRLRTNPSMDSASAAAPAMQPPMTALQPPTAALAATVCGFDEREPGTTEPKTTEPETTKWKAGDPAENSYTQTTRWIPPPWTLQETERLQFLVQKHADPRDGRIRSWDAIVNEYNTMLRMGAPGKPRNKRECRHRLFRLKKHGEPGPKTKRINKCTYCGMPFKGHVCHPDKIAEYKAQLQQAREAKRAAANDAAAKRAAAKDAAAKRAATKGAAAKGACSRAPPPPPKKTAEKTAEKANAVEAVEAVEATEATEPFSLLVETALTDDATLRDGANALLNMGSSQHGPAPLPQEDYEEDDEEDYEEDDEEDYEEDDEEDDEEGDEDDDKDEDYDPDGAYDEDDSDDDYGNEEAYQRSRSHSKKHSKKHGGNSTSYRTGGNYMYRVGVPPVIPDSQIAAEEGVHRCTIWRRRQKALKQSGRSGGGGYLNPRSMPGGSRAKGARSRAPSSPAPKPVDPAPPAPKPVDPNEPEDLHTQPLLQDWAWNSNGSLSGHVYGKSGFKNGDEIDTSKVEKDKRFTRYVVTVSGSIYQLGEPKLPRPTRARA